LANFFMVYVREQHPNRDASPRVITRDEVSVAAPETIEERQEIAKEFAAEFKLTMPVLVDNMDSAVEKVYQALPDRIYVIDRDGRVAYEGGRGPVGFVVADVPQVLDDLLGFFPGSQLDVPHGDPMSTLRQQFSVPRELLPDRE
jgi:hypothetical protein